ncbi:hypothetical protein N566_25720 [Streptomycetaceae bacterium MP113-05]|nr:hypothetical protein N566_25720 [Streptomycetaceae bacterium MP113-05]
MKEPTAPPGPDPAHAVGPAGGPAPRADGTLAFVESPVQLLNALEWAHADALPTGGSGEPLRIVVLPPHDPMTRGQLRRMAELAREEGHRVDWTEARGGTGPLKTVAALSRPLRRASRVLLGDPFSRYVQVLLALTTAPRIVVVDDGTATMEFVAQLARGDRLTRWHRTDGGGPAAALLAPVSRRARTRLVPTDGRRVDLFTAMPVAADAARVGITVQPNDFSWTRTRFGPPLLTRGTDLIGTSLVETGVVDPDRYLAAVHDLARAHGATRYFAHRRESPDKLRQVTARTGLEIVRPDLPLELVARRGPIGRAVLSFPSTVVHTLPLALAGTDVQVAVCDIDPAWLTSGASPRAHTFLTTITTTAPTRLPGTP